MNRSRHDRDDGREMEQECHNRIFVLGGKGCTSDEFKEQFTKYGDVKDVWIVKDKATNEDKGVCYITLSKASEAALAIEEMNGKTMGNNPKPLKVLLANNRREGSVRDPKEEERMLRLFIIVPKSLSEDDVRDRFKEYGDIDYVRLIKDRVTREPRGLAYVKYYRAYNAAVALENCDANFKAVFAAAANPTKRNNDNDRSGDMWGRDQGGAQPNNRYSMDYNNFDAPRPQRDQWPTSPPISGPADIIRNYHHSNETTLEVMATPSVSYEQIYKLVDLIPGLEWVDQDSVSGLATIRYSSPQCASYAKDKLGGFEYPPGYRLAVRFQQQQQPQQTQQQRDSLLGFGPSQQRGVSSSLSAAAGDLNSSLQAANLAPNMQSISSLVDTLQKATNMLQQAGIVNLPGATPNAGNAGQMAPQKDIVRYCNVDLPSTQPLANRDNSCAQRLFIVAQPSSFPEHIMQDCFCRFGSLIDAYFMPGKNFGYAKFADKDAAMEAIKVLHGQLVCGMRIKVMEAEPPKYEGNNDNHNKRSRQT